MFGLVRFQKLENVSFDRIATFVCLAATVAATHYKFLMTDKLLTPALWVWITLRSMFFLVFPFNVAAWVFSLFVARYAQIGHVGGLCAAMWAAKLMAHMVLGEESVLRPNFMGASIIFLAGTWLQIFKTRDDKSVFFRCLFSNLHAFVAWRIACYSTFPFYARKDIELLGMCMVFVVVWFMGALRFEDEKYTVENLPPGHPFPHSIKAAKACPVCAPRLREFDMETGGISIRDFYRRKSYGEKLAVVRERLEEPKPHVYQRPEAYPTTTTMPTANAPPSYIPPIRPQVKLETTPYAEHHTAQPYVPQIKQEDVAPMLPPANTAPTPTYADTTQPQPTVKQESPPPTVKEEFPPPPLQEPPLPPEEGSGGRLTPTVPDTPAAYTASIEVKALRKRKKKKKKKKKEPTDPMEGMDVIEPIQEGSTEMC